MNNRTPWKVVEPRVTLVSTEDLFAALACAATALGAAQFHFEVLSDGTSAPSRDTLKRHHDRCSDALYALERVGVLPTLTEEPR